MQAISTPSLLAPSVPDLSDLDGAISGTLVRPDDAAYDATRAVWNRVHDRHPVAIVRAADAHDVARTIAFARDAGLELAVRGGGHSLAGFSTTDGIVLDLSAMRGLHIDPDRRLAWAQPGLTAAEFTTAAHGLGLATPFGDTGSVGIAGLTLGGGIGWLVRTYGLAIDSLVSVEIVTADGRILTASEVEHPELFWAVRGGGGNFGVVTRFQYRLHPVGTVVGGALVLPATRDVVRRLLIAADEAPDGLTMIAFAMPAPPAPFIPAEVVGQPTVFAMLVHTGDIEDGIRAVAPFRAIAAPIADLVGPMPYPGIYDFTAEGGTPMPSVTRSVFARALDDAAIDAILDGVETRPGSMAQFRILGGAMARVSAEATAFAHRDAAILAMVTTAIDGESDTEAATTWADDLLEVLLPQATGVYVNFLEREGAARTQQAYAPETFARLAEVKRAYDPGNLFHLNQNVRPASFAVAAV